MLSSGHDASFCTGACRVGPFEDGLTELFERFCPVLELTAAVGAFSGMRFGPDDLPTLETLVLGRHSGRISLEVLLVGHTFTCGP